MAIKDWPAAERPREKLLAQGAAALSDGELLAIFVRTGMVGRDALEIARDLLGRFGSLSALFEASLDDVVETPGVGPAKYVQLSAVMEMARRALLEQLQHRDALTSPDLVKSYLRLQLQGRDREVFVVIYLDAQNRVLRIHELFAGTLTQTSVYPREVVKGALASNAAAVIFAHNHPSGIAEPSHADEALTQALKQALALVDIRVLDHLVIGRGAAMSFAERGIL